MERFFDPDTMVEVLRAISSYGYLVLFLGTLLQSVGLPLPAQTILVASGVMAGQDILNPYFAVLIGLVGAVAGSQIGYYFGRRGGRPVVLRIGRYVGVTPERLDRAEDFFERHGHRAILVARFVPVLKTFGYVASGLVKMPYLTFLRNDVIGTTVWAVVSVLLGMAVSASVVSVLT